MATRNKAPGGIVTRHSRKCSTRSGSARCNCSPTFEAWIWDNRVGAKVRRSFPGDLAAAKSWVSDANRALTQNVLKAKANRNTLEQAANAWLEEVRAGNILGRGGRPYKPSVVRSYDTSLRLHVLPKIGQRRLTELTVPQLQAFVNGLVSEKVNPSTIRNAVNPLRAIYRHAVSLGEVTINPCLGLQLPSVEGVRERIADPREATKLLDALPEDDCALWATALYAGLRRGELRALRCRNIDLEASTLRVEASWDDYEGEIAPKSKAGTRAVPIPATLAARLKTHLETTGWSGDDLVFGANSTQPFTSTHIRKRAHEAWAATAVGAFFARRSLSFEPIGLHECRHSYSSYLDAAGVSESRADRYMGHAVHTTPSRYRKQFDGQLAEDAVTLEAYLSGAAAGKVVSLAATA
jgi:integrase